MSTIIRKIESERGCGYRKKGGVYLVSDGAAAPCFKLPIPLMVGPCCGQGIKPTRGFMWIDKKLYAERDCARELKNDLDPGCISCPLSYQSNFDKLGLMWVGGKYYTPDSFSREAIAKGVSKRIAQIPREFKIGETWVALAHRKAIFEIPGKTISDLTTDELSIAMSTEENYKPGIFYFFKPKRIEYIIRGDEEPEHLERLEKRGVTLVDVVRDIDAKETMKFDDQQST